MDDGYVTYNICKEDDIFCRDKCNKTKREATIPIEPMSGENIDIKDDFKIPDKENSGDDINGEHEIEEDESKDE